MMRRFKWWFVASLLLAGVVSFVATGAEEAKEKQHKAVHNTGACDEKGCSTTAIADGSKNVGAACATDGSGACLAPTQSVALSGLSPEEQKVVTYIADQIEQGKSTGHFQEGEIEKATGVNWKELDKDRLYNAALSELARRGVRIQTAGSVGNCTRFNACSVDRNLNGASGEELTRYQAEKAEDGKRFTGWKAPEFHLPTIDGREISLADYRGKPVAVVFMSVHCFHSLKTLPALTELQKKYDPAGLQVLTIFVNATSVEDVAYTVRDFDVNFPVAAAKGKDLSEAYKTRMVPTTFLIDAKGDITRKLVGQKTPAHLQQAFAELADGTGPSLGMSGQ